MSEFWYKPATSAEECAAHMEAGGLVEYQTRTKGWRSPCMTSAQWFREHPDCAVDDFRLAYLQGMSILDAMPSMEQPVGMTRDDVLAALDALRERLEEQEANWLDDPGQSDWHSGRRYAINLVVQEVLSEIDTLSEDVRVRVTEQAPEQVPLHEVIGRTLPHDPSCDPNLPIVDVKSGARWGVGGWFWTAQPFPHDDATTPWTTLLVQSTGLVAVRPVAEA